MTVYYNDKQFIELPKVKNWRKKRVINQWNWES
jgi:hypothetical protein